MAEQTAAVVASNPPEPVMKVMNRALRYLLPTPLGRGPLKDFMVVNFTGRQPGRPYSLPVRAHLVDGVLYALAGSTWKLNFRGGGPAQVVHGGRTRAMRGELIEDPAEVAALFHRCASGYGPGRAQRLMGVKFREPRVPTVDEFRQVVDANNFVAIRFTAPDTPLPLDGRPS